ncbi:MAG: hypothetical protein E7514_07650 [Ruminococcaceae bacterium]|nr:hypothetical protein [Oscillospiraceae bacterium]
MSKWCFDYETGEFANIERDGFNVDRGEYTYNWDDSEYRREEEEEIQEMFRMIDDEDIDW